MQLYLIWVSIEADEKLPTAKMNQENTQTYMRSHYEALQLKYAFNGNQTLRFHENSLSHFTQVIIIKNLFPFKHLVFGICLIYEKAIQDAKYIKNIVWKDEFYSKSLTASNLSFLAEDKTQTLISKRISFNPGQYMKNCSRKAHICNFVMWM